MSSSTRHRTNGQYHAIMQNRPPCSSTTTYLAQTNPSSNEQVQEQRPELPGPCAATSWSPPSGTAAFSSKCTVLDLFIKSLQENHGSQVLCKKVFKLGEKEILVSSERSSSKETYICTMILYVTQASFHGRTKQILPFCRRH